MPRARRKSAPPPPTDPTTTHGPADSQPRKPGRVKAPKPLQEPKCSIFGIVARSSPSVLIFRRGPSAWFHLLRWRTDKNTLEPGVWVRKKLYTERCDFSDDGKYLTYALGTAREMFYLLQVGLCKAPPHDRLHTQHNWVEGVPFCGGWYFRGERELFVHDVRKTLRLDGRNFTLAEGKNAPYAHLRRRGWTLHDAESFGEYLGQTNVVYPHTFTKPGPAKTATLRCFIERGPRGTFERPRRYELLRDDGTTEPLENTTWADWSIEGHLLTATHTGVLRASIVKNGRLHRVLHEHDLSTLRPPSGNPLGPSKPQTAEGR